MPPENPLGQATKPAAHARVQPAPLDQALQEGPDRPSTSKEERLLTMKEVIAITSWSRTSVYRLVRAGTLQSYKIGKSRIAFSEAEIRQYVQSLLHRPLPKSAQCPRSATSKRKAHRAI